MENLNMILPPMVFRNYSFRYPAGNCQADISYLRPLISGQCDRNIKDCFDLAFQLALTKKYGKIACYNENVFVEQQRGKLKHIYNRGRPFIPLNVLFIPCLQDLKGSPTEIKSVNMDFPIYLTYLGDMKLLPQYEHLDIRVPNNNIIDLRKQIDSMETL